MTHDRHAHLERVKRLAKALGSSGNLEISTIEVLKTHHAAEDFGFDVIVLRRFQDACMLASVFCDLQHAQWPTHVQRHMDGLRNDGTC